MVRVREGVLVRVSGRRMETFLSLSKGDGYGNPKHRSRAAGKGLTLGSERKLTE